VYVPAYSFEPAGAGTIRVPVGGKKRTWELAFGWYIVDCFVIRLYSSAIVRMFSWLFPFAAAKRYDPVNPLRPLWS
jgi:hypothetical protein